MGRMQLAWQILTNSVLAGRIQDLLQASESPKITASATASAPEITPPPAKIHRSDAVTVLATLQREGRLVDFLMEPIESYSDAQIGAAVRDIHRLCAAALHRQLGIQPVLSGEEGSTVTVDAKSDPGRLRVTGETIGAGPFVGRLIHHGWQISKSELPQWTGSAATTGIIAPAEVEMPRI